MDRNTKGVIGWSAIALVLGIVTLIPMIIREWYQYKKYQLEYFEWDDVARYGMFILIFSLFHWCITDIIGLNWVFML